MKLETAQRIVEAAKDVGDDVALRENYSGRGMFGETTAGVVGRTTDILAAVANAAFLLGKRGEQADVESFFHDVHRLSQDSMGRETIVY